MNEIEILDSNELFGKKSLNDVVMDVKNLQAQTGEKLIRIGKELAYAKDNGFFQEAIEKLDKSRTYANKFIKAYERFGSQMRLVSLPDSKITELVSFPEDIPTERLIEMGQTMTRQQLRGQKAFLKGNTPKKELSDLQKAERALNGWQNKLSEEEFLGLLRKYIPISFEEGGKQND
jgi:hypothetical protein